MITNQPQRTSSSDLYYFDEEAAQRAVRFIQTYCTFTQGELMGKPITLLPFQREIIENAFGWKRKSDGLRRYRYIYLEIPKKNGKSMLLSAIGLYLLMADREPGAEVYSVAGDRQQARIIFEASKQMIEQNETLSSMCEITRDAVVYKKTYSKFQVLSSETSTKHGFNIHGLLFDELHVQPDGELFSTLEKGTVARKQAQVWMITTAGMPGTFAESKHLYAKQLAQGLIENDRWLVYIYDPPEDTSKAWDEKTWFRTNPALGISIPVDVFREQAERAKNDPSERNSFLRLHLNYWIGAQQAWDIAKVWDECKHNLNLANYKNKLCYVGVDLAARSDLTAVSLIFPEDDGTFALFVKFFMPEGAMKEKQERSFMHRWVPDYIELTNGQVTDLQRVIEYVRWCCKAFRVASVGYDKWNALPLARALNEDGQKTNIVSQTLSTLTVPTKFLERIVLNKKLKHDGNPCLRWQVNNAYIYEDVNGNRKPDRKNSQAKIDGIAATLNALSEYLRLEYEDDGQKSMIYLI